MSLINTVRSELQARKGDWPELCRTLDISYWWLIKFGQGRIENPGVKKLEALQAHFDSNPRPPAADVAPKQPEQVA